MIAMEGLWKIAMLKEECKIHEYELKYQTVAYVAVCKHWKH